MTGRELRNQRRAAERKARKLECQQNLRGATSVAFASDSPASAGSAALPPNPELLDEFTMEEQTEMMALRARVHARAAVPEPPLPVKPGPTGPRSIEGKATSSGNSLKHGLASGRIIVPGEDPAGFEVLLTDLTAEHAPATETEALLVQQMAQSWWLTQRAIRLQNQAFTETRVDVAKLALFLRYQTTHERAFYKALNTLIKIRAERRKSNPVGAMHASPVSQNRRSTHTRNEFVSQNTVGEAGIAPSERLEFSDPPLLDRQAA